LGNEPWYHFAGANKKKESVTMKLFILYSDSLSALFI
jgi:hypothetical protein